MIPKSRPKINETEARRLLDAAGIQPHEVAVIGVRGYYAKTMGPTPDNDRGIYDDAIIIVTPDGYWTFNANVDPNVTRQGAAVLKPGVWRYKPGQHGITFNRPGYPYPAFVQADKVTVARDNQGDDTGWFGINIHRGSNTSTSSLGCQTIPPAQWELFRDILKSALKQREQTSFPYLLTKPISS